MTREEELIRLLVRESIKEELELNELLGMNLFGKKDQTEVVPGTELNLTPQQAKTQLDNHLSGKIKINDPNRLKKVQDIVNKNFPQPKQTPKQNYNAFDDDREANNHSAKMKSAEDPWSHEKVPAPVARTQYGQVGRAAESKKRRKATLR